VADAGVNIRMISQGASEINISFVVSEEDVPKAVRRLHEHFFPREHKNAPVKTSSRAHQEISNNGDAHSDQENAAEERKSRSSRRAQRTAVGRA
jgi:hypothetical protein